MIAILRILLLVLWTLPWLVIKIVMDMLRIPGRRSIPGRWHRGVLRILRVRVQRVGQISKHKPTLFVSNHASYIDILLLGASLPASFVAKKEIESWPILGFLAKLQETVFVERNPRLAREHSNQVAERLNQKRNIVVFPEGTTGNGQWVLPFKSTLFSVADMLEDDKELYVQPVSIVYLAINGIQAGRSLRPYLTWFGDMSIGAHLWQLLSLGTINVRMIYHEPVLRQDFESRKDLAAWCETKVADGLRQALSTDVSAGSARVRRFRLKKKA